MFRAPIFSIIFVIQVKEIWCLFAESVAYEWGSKQGLIRYYYHLDHRPDTRADVLSLGFITPLQDCVVIRVDSEASNDYIELEIVSLIFLCLVRFERVDFILAGGGKHFCGV